MKTSNMKHMMYRWMTVLLLLSAICLYACEEITDETYTDIEMVIPASTGKFKFTAYKCTDQTLVTISDVKFHENLQPIGIQVDEVRYYIDDNLLAICKEAPYNYEGLIDNLLQGDHVIRMEYDLSGEGFLPSTGKHEKAFQASDMSHPWMSADLLNLDDRTLVNVDTLDFRSSVYDNLTVTEARYYINDQLVGIDTKEPYSFQGFIDKLAYGEYQFIIQYDFTTPYGTKAMHTVQEPVKTDTLSNYFYETTYNFDGQSYLKIDTIRPDYHLSNCHLGIAEMRFYLDKELVHTDKEAPFSLEKLVKPLADAQHNLKIVYDVVNQSGEKASATMTRDFKTYTPSYNLFADATHFNEKTYLQIDEMSVPYAFGKLGITFNEMRYYINDQLIHTSIDKPESIDRFVELLEGDNHIAKAIYDATLPDGTVVSKTFIEDLTIHNNSIYMYPEEPSPENGNAFKMNDLSFSWEIYKCQLTVTEAKYYIDGQLVKTIDKAPFTFELENPSFTQGLHTLRLEYKVKDTSGTTATWQGDTSFYISKE